MEGGRNAAALCVLGWTQNPANPAISPEAVCRENVGEQCASGWYPCLCPPASGPFARGIRFACFPDRGLERDHAAIRQDVRGTNVDAGQTLLGGENNQTDTALFDGSRPAVRKHRLR